MAQARFDLRGRSLRQHAARGTLINTAFLAGLSLLGLLKGFLLAGFLSADDYGVWGVLVVSLGTVVWLKQVGIGDKYIQQEEEDQELAFQKAFTLEAIFTGGFTLLLAALLPVIVLVYGETQLFLPGLAILAVMPAQVLQAPLWVYYRRMDFLRQRTLQALDPVVGFIVAVALAIAGAGYWAFVGGLLAGAWSAALAAIIFSPFKLRFRYDGGTLRRYVSFSGPIFLASVGGMVIAQSATIGAEAHLGLAAAGAMALAASISAFTNRVDELVTGTLYPAICAVADRTELLYESFVKTNRLALIWAMPFGLALTLFSPDLVDFAIGEKWEPAVILLQSYGLIAAFGHLGFNWDAYFRARAETRPMAIASLAAMFTFLAVGMPLLFTYDLKGLAIGIAAHTFVHLCFRAYYLGRLFDGFAFLRHAARAMAPVVPAVAVVLLMRLAETGTRTAGIAFFELGIYVLIVIAATWMLEGRLIRETLGYVIPGRAVATGR